MANPIKGEVAVECDGKTYTVLLDFNALCEFEEATGKDVQEFLDSVQDGGKQVRLTDMRTLMWAGLKQHHPDITLQQAGRIMGAGNGVVMQALAASFGTAEAGATAGNGGKRKARAG